MSPRPESQPSMRQSVIQQQCVVLHLPTVASQCAPLAEQAERERQPYLGYLEALFAAELEERERRAIDRRIKEAHLPRVKTLGEFDFRQAPTEVELAERFDAGQVRFFNAPVDGAPLTLLQLGGEQRLEITQVRLPLALGLLGQRC